MFALTHAPSPNMHACVRTYLPHAEINHSLAVKQHAAYCDALRACGASVIVLNVNSDLPDSVFIEDTAVILSEVAVLCSLGAESRRPEPAGIEQALAYYRQIIRIEPPATLEGGDVLRINRTLLVGRSSRTNSAGIAQLTAIGDRYGYTVRPIEVKGCLHLKTACTAFPTLTRRASEGMRGSAPAARLLINPHWLDTSSLANFDLIPVPADEPWAANIAWINSTALLSSAHPKTTVLIHSLGFDTHPLDLSEFEKAEGGPTCLSLLIPEPN